MQRRPRFFRDGAAEVDDDGLSVLGHHDVVFLVEVAVRHAALVQRPHQGVQPIPVAGKVLGGMHLRYRADSMYSMASESASGKPAERGCRAVPPAASGTSARGSA